MKVLIDLNILLDIFQEREPHYFESSRIVDELIQRQIPMVISSHGITTLYYIISKHDKNMAHEMVDWILELLLVGKVDYSTLKRARILALNDFEDSVSVAVAEQEECTHIITRDLDDFDKSPIIAIPPIH